jgi:hypothetical protein
VDFYRGSLNNFYDRHRNLEGGLFLETLLTLIIMEYDWSEPGVDKDELARQYLGKSLYDANRSRRGR